jgi:hypothetical protein
MTVDLDKWDAEYGIYGYLEKSELYGGPYPIVTRQGEIVDACVGFVKGCGPSVYDSSENPVALFLMADGTVEYMEIYPYAFYMEYAQRTRHALYWLTDIVSLSFENEGDGRFDNTVYAVDKNGVRYDTNIPLAFHLIGMGEWYAELSPEYSGILSFLDESRCTFEIHEMSGWPDVSAGYEGNYEIVINEGHESGCPPGTILFELYKHWTSGDAGVFDDQPYELIGAYTINIDYGDTSKMDLRLANGDALLSLGGIRPSDYVFELEQWGSPTISPDVRDYLLGSWECFRPGRLGCRWDVYANTFNGNLDFTLTFIQPDGGSEWQLNGYIESGSWFDDDADDRGEIKLRFYDQAMDPESYWFWGSGFKRNMIVHKGRLMMGLYSLQYGSVFSEMEDYESLFMFAKETGDTREGSRLTSARLTTTFWEWDRDRNLIWLDNRDYFSEESNTTAYTTPYPVAEGADIRGVEDIWPGGGCYVEINDKGEIIAFDLQGD